MWNPFRRHKHHWTEIGRGPKDGVPLHPNREFWYQLQEIYMECFCGSRTIYYRNARLKTWKQDRYSGKEIEWVFFEGPEVRLTDSFVDMNY